MKYLFILLLFFSCQIKAQEKGQFLSVFLLEDELLEENLLDKYEGMDFSHLWTQTENFRIKGMIGTDHQRIRIALTSITQNKKKQLSYRVLGKSRVKDNICAFSGTIQIDSIKEVKDLHWGVDNNYKDSSILAQGVLFASFAFHESKEQNHSGLFKGLLMTKWFITSEGELKYDNIQSLADGYSNNAFIGSWTQYGSKKSKICNWADDRIPLAANDFDVGAGEFSPSEKYYPFGWEEYQKAWFHRDEQAMRKELEV